MNKFLLIIAPTTICLANVIPEQEAAQVLTSKTSINKAASNWFRLEEILARSSFERECTTEFCKPEEFYEVMENFVPDFRELDHDTIQSKLQGVGNLGSDSSLLTDLTF